MDEDIHVTVVEKLHETGFVLACSDATVTLSLPKHWREFTEHDVDTIVMFGKRNRLPFRRKAVNDLINGWLPLAPACGIAYRWSWIEGLKELLGLCPKRLVFHVEVRY